MSKLQKGQNVNKSAEETAAELDGEISMDSKLIGKFITQQVSATMTEKTKHYETKIKNWGKLERMDYWESKKKETRGGGCASRKTKKFTTQTTTKSKTHKKSAS